MPNYIFALLSAILWASSAPIINYGLKNMPGKNSLQFISIGLLSALLSGTILLTLVVVILDLPVQINCYLLLSGIFTYPVGTGAYYIASELFKKRAEFASVFSKVKPLISFTLATIFIKEIPSNSTIISLGFILVGTSVLVIGSKKEIMSLKGTAIGLLTASSWALGEVFMKLGISDSHPIAASWVALLSGSILYTLFILVFFKQKDIGQYYNKKIIFLPFIIHGILSFAIAYTLFFFSIKEIGVARSAIINAFWPILSICIALFIRKLKKERLDIPISLVIATLLLLIGSLIQILGS